MPLWNMKGRRDEYRHLKKTTQKILNLYCYELLFSQQKIYQPYISQRKDTYKDQMIFLNFSSLEWSWSPLFTTDAAKDWRQKEKKGAA